MKSPHTLVELLMEQAAMRRDSPAYIFIAEDGSEQTLTYGELNRKARCIAATLMQKAAPGTRAILVFPPGLDYISAFFGCLYAGIIAVPTYPINPARPNHASARLLEIIADCTPDLVLTNTQLHSALHVEEGRKLKVGNAAWLDTASLTEGAGNWRCPDLGCDSLAFLQYTSGSTSVPKGVMVSHGNLLHNERAIQIACRHNEDSTFVGWLPLFHDMGLIGNILQPLYLGSKSVLMSPMSFLQSPVRWLQAISKYKACTSGGPNFGYELCVKKISREETLDLDLSTWRIAFNGAEPVRHFTLDRFAEAFQHCGFRREAFFPCYGLAEGTLMVSGGPPSNTVLCNLDRDAFSKNHIAISNHAESQAIIGCGSAMVDQKVSIVDPVTLREAAPNTVGEIWVKGPSVTFGYWNRPEQTREIFQAHIATGEGPFLRTGDLGFVRDDQVFIAGRKKDLIIIRGRNYYPQDIEKSSEESAPALRKGCSAAFSIEIDGEEALIVLQEVDRHANSSPETLAAGLRAKIVSDHGIQPYAVVLLSPGGVLKTTSGKVQRSACRAAFLQNHLPVLYTDQKAEHSRAASQETISRELYFSLQPEFRASAIESYLVHQAADILKRPIGLSELRQPVVTLGFDSLNAADLASRIENALNVRIGLAEILENCSLASLAARISGHLEKLSLAVSTTPSGTAQSPGAIPLSYGQQAFWIIDQVKKDIGENNLSNAVLLGEDTDLVFLKSAFELLRERHEQLRATFIKTHDGPVQAIVSAKDVPIDFRVENVSSYSDVDFKQMLAEEVKRPFDLAAGRPFRVRVYTGQGPRPILLAVFHHSIMDFWSIGILVSELAKVYSCLKSGAAVFLSALNARYADFIQWQTEFINSNAGEQAWSYWKAQLKGALPVLNLPKIPGTLGRSTSEISSVPIFLSAEHLAVLKQAARARSVTLNSYILAAFATLLHRHTGQDEIMIGAPATGRASHPKFRDVVGYFVNSLPLRMDLSGDPQFTQFAAGVQNTLLGAMRHQDFPLSLMMERLKLPRHHGIPPLFQALFVWQQAHLPGMEGLTALTFAEQGAKWNGGGLSLETYTFQGETARFDLTLFASESPSGLHATLKYRSDLFHSSLMESMAAQFATLLKEIAAAPERLLSEFALMNSTQEASFIQRINSGASMREPASLIDLFDAQAVATPNVPALIDDETELTYSELECRVNNVAAYLVRCGIGPEQRIAVFLPRNINAIVSILGIWKAGAAYVPVHIGDPKIRVEHIFKDAKVSLVITESSLLDHLPEGIENLVLIDLEPELMGNQSAVPEIAVPLHGSNLAYIIYTSGSTGTPKGVMVQHDSVLNLLNGLKADVYSHFSDRRLRVGLNAPLSFDGSVKQLVTLALGHTLYVLPETVRRDPTAFAAFIESHQLDVLDCTPSQAEMLYAAGGASAADQTMLLLGGEAITESLWQRLSNKPQFCVNVYGPTECTVDATCCCIMPGTVSSLGRPLSTTRVYVLDRHFRILPPGVPGQICIAGPGVARGYDDRPDLTAEKFVPDPFADRKGGRMYLSGDSARYFPDGTIEYLGRIDRQVKIRGFRIEPGEIESALKAYPGVSDAAVVAREVGDMGTCLVGYIVLSGSQIEIDELKKNMQSRLPDYMVPAVLSLIPEIPLTASGKRDLNALPDPVAIQSVNSSGADLPRSPIEQALAFMWRRALRVDTIRINDDFFALGGHSLLATRLVSTLQEIFQTDVPLLTLFFQDPTIAGLAKALAQTRLGQTRLDEVARALQKFELLREAEDTERSQYVTTP